MNTNKNILFVALIIVVPLFGHAQLINFASRGIEFDITPETPAPFDQVFVSIQNFSVDLDRSRVTWTVDGRQIASQIGEKNISFRMGDVGTSKTVEVSVRSPDGATFSKSVDISVTDLTLVYEADTSTPLFYRGKALASAESLVTVSALTNKKGLVYTWKVDDKTKKADSGFERSSILFATSELKSEHTVSVEAREQDGTVFAKKSISMALVTPLVRLYEEHPLGGTLYRSEFGRNKTPKAQETTFRAEPYYFSKDDLAAGLIDIIWRVNNEQALGFKDARNVLTIRNEKGGDSTMPVSVEIIHKDKLLQQAGRAFTLTYEE